MKELKDIMLDKEWEELIILALNAGITVEEIKNFFSQPSETR
ncbi:anti-repressor SinI family protein [Metabacillus fastidiosus]|nr:anti-repressor SinI family protein [Metabacillus fastidiosus]MEC2078383.1 anti-repressor SinI family protein [Metabacillus fastidiosus]